MKPILFLIAADFLMLAISAVPQAAAPTIPDALKIQYLKAALDRQEAVRRLSRLRSTRRCRPRIKRWKWSWLRPTSRVVIDSSRSWLPTGNWCAQ